MTRESMRSRLWQRYMKLKGFVWNGYHAPEQCPDVRSDSVIALMQIVEELEARVDEQHSEIEKLKNKVVVLGQGDVYWRNR